MKRAILLIGILLAFDAGAAFESGNDLMKYCSEYGKETFYSGVCIGYTTAVADVMGKDSASGFRACLPKNITTGQIHATSIKYLRDNPEFLHYTANSLVAAALSVAFPCKQ